MAVHVMVIDPSVTIRKILEISLRRAGYIVVGFADPLVAIRFLYACPDCIPGVLMVALHLPGMGFYHVIQRFLSCAPFRRVAIIALLNQRDSLVARFLARMAGAALCITKPFKTRDIVDKVSKRLLINPEKHSCPVVPLSG